MNPVDEFYFNLSEPVKSCFLALKDIIFQMDENITTSLKYGMPFFFSKGKRFCYFWIDKKTKEPYIGFTEGKWLHHPSLETGDRTRIKIFRVNPSKDIDIYILQTILRQALDYCTSQNKS